VRSAALVALTLDDLRRKPSRFAFALKDLTMLDGALARLATALEMEVSDHDTIGREGDDSDRNNRRFTRRRSGGSTRRAVLAGAPFRCQCWCP
jgi:hypothetical protein